MFIAYRSLWWIAFAAVLALTLVIGPRDESATQAKYQAFMTVGVSCWWNPSVQGQYGGPFGDVGSRAGIAEGDLVTAINGRLLPPDTAGRVAALAFPDGERVAVTARRPDGQVYTTHVVRSSHYEHDAYAGWHISFNGRRWMVFAVNMIANLVSLAAALLLFLRRPRDPVAAILALALLTTPLGSASIATTITGIGGVIASTIPGFATTLAVLLFPDGRLKTRWHWLALALAVAVLPYNFVAAPINYLYQLISYGGNLALVLAVWSQFRLTPSGTERQQIKFVLLGVVAGILLATVGNVLDGLGYQPMPEGQRAWMSVIKWTIYAFANLALPVGLLVSLTRYRLYDADSTISRSVVYGTLTLALLAIFAGSEKMLEILGEQYFGERLGALASGLGAGFAALMMVPLHRRVTRWAEQRFQGNLVHLRNALPVLVGDMGTTATPARLADTVLMRIEKGVRAVHGAVIAGHELLAARDVDADAVRAWLSTWREPVQGESQLHADRDDPLFPLRVPLYSDSVGFAGWLLLGPRPDGSFYGKDERDTLLTVAEPVARAIVAARQREAGEIERKREIGGLASRVTAVETRLTGFVPYAA